jgi:hypothetical protein
MENPGAAASAVRPPSRVAAAALISVLSIALAEVLLGSSPWGLVHPVQLVYLLPVYGGQVLLIGTLVLRRQPHPTLPALWSAGVVMGLYEFYITRVAWGYHDWGTPEPVAGVDIVALLVVLMFWHPFMAFILPLALAEQALLREPRLMGLLLRRDRRAGWRSGRGWTWAGVLAAAVVSGGYMFEQGSPLVAAGALASAAVAVWLAMRFARRRQKADSWDQVLPTRAGLVWVGAVVALYFAPFVAWAVWWEPVPWRQQAAAWVLYALFAALTVRSLRVSAPERMVRVASGRVWWWRFAVFLPVAVGLSLSPVAHAVAVALVSLGGIAVAVWMFVRAVRGAVLVRRPVASLDVHRRF